MSELFTISREIGIDMGHRVTYHGSKCRNLHGHRYTISVTCVGKLFTSGEQEGMVLDFGFLKEEMMTHIDGPCDHGTCLWVEDPLLGLFVDDPLEFIRVKEEVTQHGHSELIGRTGKLYVIDCVPTAENLARHWGHRLNPAIINRSGGEARIRQIDVWETPNCVASYQMPFDGSVTWTT